MLHMQLKRRINRAILSAMLLSLLLAAEAVPAQAAGRAELAMDGKAVPSGTVVAMPEGSVAAFSLKLDGSLGTGYTSGNGAVAQTRTVQRQARHAPPAKRQDALRSRLNMEHGIPMANRGPVPILLTGRMPAKRWTPTMPIDVQHVAPPPS